MSPTTKTSGWPGTVRSGRTSHATRTVQARTGLLGDLLPERAGLHAGRPDLGERLDVGGCAVGPGDRDAGRVDVGDLGAQAHVDPHGREPPAGGVAQALTEGRQHGVDGVDEDDPRPGRVDVAEVVLQGAVGELGDLPGHLHAGGTGTDDDEGQRSLGLGGRAGQLGQLEGAEDAPAQLQGVVDRLHAGRVARELVVAEPRLAGARGDEQAVVGRDALTPEHRRGDGARLEVDVGDGAEHDAGVLLAGEHLTRARGDLTLGQDARRHLVQQRLEEVVRGRGDEGDLDVLAALERLGAEEASEARTDDDDSVGGGHVRSNAGAPRGMPPAQAGGRGHHRGRSGGPVGPRNLDALTRCG